MFLTNHGPTKNEKSSVHLSSCGKNNGKSETHGQHLQGEEKCCKFVDPFYSKVSGQLKWPDTGEILYPQNIFYNPF